MKTITFKDGVKRREFCRLISATGIAASISPTLVKPLWSQSEPPPKKPKTNIDIALKTPRTKSSMPGKYPGQVVEIYHSKSIVNHKPDPDIAYQMLENGMLELTGAFTISAAWREFISPDDIIGLKVNPVAGKLLSTSLEVTNAVIKQLELSGVPRKNIIIWDRREFELHEVGFTEKNFPGIQITGTERKDINNSFYDSKGNLYGESMIDKDWYYWADCEMEYDEETLPYMVNEGKYSYFSKIVTKELTKIINIPILKNAGSTVTLCLKNLAYGAITNTARLHKQLWSETCAQVPCFMPLRDKVVLNIVDGLKGCYNGGPGANPQFITEYNTLLVGTDPVAADRIGYDIVLKRRIAEKIQKAESPRGLIFMDMAKNYGLGESALTKITHQRNVVG